VPSHLRKADLNLSECPQPDPDRDSGRPVTDLSLAFPSFSVTCVWHAICVAFHDKHTLVSK